MGASIRRGRENDILLPTFETGQSTGLDGGKVIPITCQEMLDEIHFHGLIHL